MTPESDRLHNAAQDERTRDHREKRIREEERALARRRLQPILVVPVPSETDFPGCTT